MKKITIDPEFKAAIPAHRPEERDGLEASILADGAIISPLVIWEGILLDGHNRYEIALKHKLKFPTVEMEFKDREEALIWIRSHQLNRRNLSDFARTELVLALKKDLAAQAKKRQGRKPENIVHNEGTMFGRTRDAVAEAAGVSHSTVDKVETVIADATPAIADMARAGTISTAAAAQVSTLSAKEQKKLAAAGAKAVKAAAAAVRKAKKEEKAAEPVPVFDLAKPWMNDLETPLREIQSELRSISSRLNKILAFDPKTGRSTHPYGHGFYRTSTAAAINQVIRGIEDAMPVELAKGAELGYRNKRDIERRKAVLKHD